MVDAVVKKGIAEYFDAQVFRAPALVGGGEKAEFPVLSEEQQRAFCGLKAMCDERKAAVALLYGVTGSGKTAVFMQLIKSVIDEGRGVILMVPEIALTPQLVEKMTSLFKDEVAVFHSGLSLGERVDEYTRVRKGLAKIAVGTRTAVFAPFENLGLIVMDEEQEHTYKSENKPRFHARDIAKFRCAKENSLLLLSSATPDVESYYFAKTGRYSLFTLGSRYGTATLPEVISADMNIEAEGGNTTGFSSVLLSEIEENLKNKKQTILLLNRRGYNTFAVCRSCKEAVTCPNCSISLTYHKENGRLMCHYCGYSQTLSDECPSCHESSLRFCGTGTQKGEETLSELFPEARILRMDMDTTRKKGSYAEILESFAKREADILIGTQMIVKGHDFPAVTLVGVLLADLSLHGSDYMAAERTFQLLTQAVGRAGRGSMPGHAVIQTYQPEHYAVREAAAQNYESFYELEIAYRDLMSYPPMSGMMAMLLQSEDEALLEKEAEKIKTQILEMDIPLLRITGPAPAVISKLNDIYRKVIYLKHEDAKYLYQVREWVDEAVKNEKLDKQVRVEFDENPLYVY